MLLEHGISSQLLDWGSPWRLWAALVFLTHFPCVCSPNSEAAVTEPIIQEQTAQDEVESRPLPEKTEPTGACCAWRHLAAQKNPC